MSSQFVRFTCGKGHFTGRVRIHYVYDCVPKARRGQKRRKSRGWRWTRPSCPVCAVDHELQRLSRLRQAKKGPGFIRD